MALPWGVTLCHQLRAEGEGLCFRGFPPKTTPKPPPKASWQAEGRGWRQLMAFHLQELRKCSQQSTGSAPSSYKLINETSQLGSRGRAKQHSMDFIFSCKEL